MLRDPFLAEPFRLMDQVFGRAFGNGHSTTGWVPTLDVRETDDQYLVLLDLPGVKEEDVIVELKNDVLTISGTRVPVETGEAQRVERPFGSFVRNLTLPQGVDGDKIVADYADGVLTLHIPKPADATPKKIAIGGSNRQAIER
ncbi:MAG TPA: Hsp20/alpha crystallin family protein [Gaiellaceae bacterium]|nr:Hsp20/alpha crystallin family protein [Gaiellaceae bacterium]